jgi:hypothetical protein
MPGAVPGIYINTEARTEEAPTLDLIFQYSQKQNASVERQSSRAESRPDARVSSRFSPLEMASKLTGIQGLFTCLRFAKSSLKC